MADSDSSEGRGRMSLPVKAVRALTLFVLFPVILLMNACILVMEEQRDTATSGALTAKVILVNAGAMSDYSGAVWVLPRYFPRIWPLDVLVACRALNFDSDPHVDVAWQGSTLTIEHDPFAHPVATKQRCYGRAIRLRERQPQLPIPVSSGPSS
jgi:hypothetical protein